MGHSREEPAQEPQRRRTGLIEPVAIEPEAPPRLVLDPVIVADLRLCGLPDPAPPFGGDPFRPLGMAHAMHGPAPTELERRIVRHEGRDLDRIGPREQPDRALPVLRPSAARALLEGRYQP